MEEDKTVTITFHSNEIQIYNIMEQYCHKNGIAVSEYIKDIIKKDLAWGHFTKRKKKKRKKPDINQ